MTIAEKDRDFQLIMEAAKAQNWVLERTNKGHWKFLAPNGKGTVLAGGSYKGPRDLKNLVARLRKLGFETPRRGSK